MHTQKPELRKKDPREKDERCPDPAKGVIKLVKELDCLGDYCENKGKCKEC